MYKHLSDDGSTARLSFGGGHSDRGHPLAVDDAA